MRQSYPAIQTAGATVLAITFESQDHTRNFIARQELPFPFALDPARDSYAAYGLQRGGAMQLSLNPGVAAKTIAIGLRNPGHLAYLAEGPQHDYKQLGGDFVVGPDGRLRYAKASLNAADFAPLADLLAAVKP